MSLIDVAIIGGGPAGLSATSTLARQLHTAVVFNSQVCRNAKSTSMHMVPGWENRDPKDFSSLSPERRPCKLFHCRVCQRRTVGVATIEKKDDAHFLVSDVSGKEWHFGKILLSVGSSNIFPSIDGYEQLWGDRIFHCLFCKEYEDRGAAPAGVLAVSPLVMPPLIIHVAMDAAQLADQVTIYTHGNEDLAKQLAPIASAKFRIESRPIKKLVQESGSKSVTIEFVDGSSKNEAFSAHSPQTTVQGPFVDQLGLSLTPMGDLQADAPMHQTSVRGVFAAGDCITPYKVIPGAISSGCNAAVAASAQLHAEKYGQPAMF